MIVRRGGGEVRQLTARAFWALRDDVGQVVVGGMPVVFDISLPIAAMERYVAASDRRPDAGIGEHRLWIFGHLGDGNLHVIVQVPPQDYVTLRPKIEALVYGPLGKLGGSVSAEHGIGLEKKPYLSVCRSEGEIALMRALKSSARSRRDPQSRQDLLTGGTDGVRPPRPTAAASLAAARCGLSA